MVRCRCYGLGVAAQRHSERVVARRNLARRVRAAPPLVRVTVRVRVRVRDRDGCPWLRTLTLSHPYPDPDPDPEP